MGSSSLSFSTLKMKGLLTLLVLVQAINFSIQNYESYRTYDTDCFDKHFPDINLSNENTTKPSGAGEVSVRVLHTREWTGSTGSIEDVEKDDIYTLQPNFRTVFTYFYTPQHSYSSWPNYNPRHLTLLYDSDSQKLKAAIGILDESSGSYGDSVTWEGCDHALLQNAAVLTFETNSMLYPMSNVWGTGREQLHIQIR